MLVSYDDIPETLDGTDHETVDGNASALKMRFIQAGRVLEVIDRYTEHSEMLATVAAERGIAPVGWDERRRELETELLGASLKLGKMRREPLPKPEGA